MENLRGDKHAGHAPFHVDCSPTVDPVLHQSPGKWRINPMRQLSGWHHVNVPGQQDRSAAAASFSCASLDRPPGEVAAFLCPWFAGIFLQQRACIGLPKLRRKAACHQALREIFLAQSLAGSGLGWIRHNNALEADQVLQRVREARAAGVHFPDQPLVGLVSHLVSSPRMILSTRTLKIRKHPTKPNCQIAFTFNICSPACSEVKKKTATREPARPPDPPNMLVPPSSAAVSESNSRFSPIFGLALNSQESATRPANAAVRPLCT